jgi:hypothetical protein
MEQRVIDVDAMAAKLPPITEEEWQESKRRTDEEWAKVRLPAGWVERAIGPESFAHGCCMATRGKTGVLFSVGKHEGQWWLHVSIAHPDKLPAYLDLALAHDVFIGRSRQALQVFPAHEEHVNIHPRALHL